MHSCHSSRKQGDNVFGLGYGNLFSASAQLLLVAGVVSNIRFKSVVVMASLLRSHQHIATNICSSKTFMPPISTPALLQ